MSGAQLVAIGFGAAFAATGIGAPIGFLVGSIVGNLLFPPKGTTAEGPRLGDLKVSSSSYGAPRAIGFGTMRMAGNMIWTAGIREQKNTSKVSGGKGSMMSGPDQKQTTYSYFGTFAMAFGEGPAADCLRIWADSKLIFDKRSTTLNMKKAGLNFRFYPGTEDQLPDPDIIAKEGAANTPAFRGTVMIVFDDLALRDFGNRYPNITAEIAYEATSNRASEISTNLVGGTATSWQLDDFAIDWERGFVYAVDTTTDANYGHLRKFTLSDLVEVQQINGQDSLTQTESGTGFLGNGSICLPNGDFVTVIDTPSGGNTEPIVRLDPYTLKEKKRFGVGSSSLVDTPLGFVVTSRFAVISLFGFNGREDYLLCGSLFNNLGVLDVTEGRLDHVWNSDSFSTGIAEQRIHSICGGKIGESVGYGYALTGGLYTVPSTDPFHIYEVEVTAGAKMTVEGAVTTFSGVDFAKILTLNPADLFPGQTTIADLGGLVYDRTDDTIMFWARNNTIAETRWYKYNPNTGAQVWKTEPLDATVVPNDDRYSAHSRIEDHTFGYGQSNNGALIDTQTGELLINDTPPDYAHEIGNGLGGYDSRTETFVGIASGAHTTPIIRYYFNRVTPVDANVGTIVKNICQRVGLVEADLDTTSIDGMTVPGSLIGRQTSAKAAILPLAQTFLFDGVESDEQLKFIARGGASVRTIPQADFAELSKGGELLKISRMQEVELPERFTIVYLDKDKDYNQNAHHAKRIQEPTPAMRSDNELGVDFPGALSATFAKQQTEKIMYTTWTERNNYESRIPWTHLDLDPSDVVTLSLTNGTQLRCRISKADVGANLEISLNLIGEESNQFVSTVLGDSGSGVPTQTVPSSTYVIAKLLDIPLLRDADEVPSRASNPVYAAMGTAQAGAFLAGTLHKSSDNQIFDPVQFFVSEMNWGSTLNALGNPPSGGLWGLDETNSLTVRLISGAAEMVSVTQLEMLNGANGAALIKTNGEIEVIQYRDVVTNADGSFTLTNLLRGRRGTDTMSEGHTAGEIFLMLIPSDLEKFFLTLGERNVLRYYKSVGSGQLFQDGELQTLTSAHRALMPYAVSHVTATPGASDSIDFAWVRRTRVGGELQDSFGVVPVSEDSEEYEIDIYSGPGGSVVRTVTGLTSPAYNYTSADQTTDGFTPPISSVTIRVYQISAQVGRGFSKELTLNVE